MAWKQGYRWQQRDTGSGAGSGNNQQAWGGQPQHDYQAPRGPTWQEFYKEREQRQALEQEKQSVENAKAKKVEMTELSSMVAENLGRML